MCGKASTVRGRASRRSRSAFRRRGEPACRYRHRRRARRSRRRAPRPNVPTSSGRASASRAHRRVGARVRSIACSSTSRTARRPRSHSASTRAAPRLVAVMRIGRAPRGRVQRRRAPRNAPRPRARRRARARATPARGEATSARGEATSVSDPGARALRRTGECARGAAEKTPRRRPSRRRAHPAPRIGGSHRAQPRSRPPRSSAPPRGD